MLAGALLDDAHRLVERHAGLVDTLGYEGIENVRDCHDARRQRDLLAREAAGVALAVPFLVVVVRHIFGLAEIVFVEGFALDCLLDGGDDLRAFFGVRLHYLVFFVFELARLVQDRIGDLDLADVVHRRGGDDVVLVGLIDHIGVETFVDELVADDRHVCGCVLDVRARRFVAALDQVGHDGDHVALEGRDGFVLALGLVNEVDRVARRFRHRLIQMLDLVTCLDLDRVDTVECLFSGLVIVIGKVARKLCKAVDRRNDVALCEVDASRQDRDEKAHQDRRDLESERPLDVADIGHRDVNADIGLGLAPVVVNGEILGNKPAVLVTRLDDRDLLARDQVGFVFHDVVFVRNDLARLVCGLVGRRDIENNVHAVLLELVDIKELDPVRAAPDEL